MDEPGTARPPGGFAPRRRDFTTADVDRMCEFLEAVYGTCIEIRVPAPAPAQYRMSCVDTASVGVGELELPGTLDFTSGPPRLFVVVTVRSGHIALEDGREDHCFGPGRTFLGGRPGRPRTARTEDAVVDVLALPWAVVQATARQAVPACRRPVRFTGLAPADEARAMMWQRTAEFVRRSLLSREAPVPPLVLGEAGRLLAATALAVFPNDVVAHPLDRPEGRDFTSDTLRRAVVFIENNADRDIGLADIAGSVPVTPRAVQYAFARHANTTPLAFLRRVRLAQVHAELRAAAPAGSGTTVTEVASRWGFTHAGRFAAAYRDAYGTSPSQTLRSPLAG
ncbi:helix-turn-helix transcriptional regulator [Streptomyces sp. NPDC127106]|uniref:helix-turn-helix transcriptional regulator n=1 Tax=Streptomyces sp. NPDC127106 TaxID=3345360 RepID=UPI00362B4A1D